MLGPIILIITVWSFLTFLLLSVDSGPFEAEGFEFVNPVYIYKHCRVNVFGAIVITIFMSLICPIGTVGYWIYKLCTIGRKDDIKYY